MYRDYGIWQSVEYSSFSVGPETDKYRLNVAGFSGDVGDALANPVSPERNCNGMKFTTRDQDNDRINGLCTNGEAGWWFNACHRSLLNYGHTKAVWVHDHDHGTRDIKFARMLVKLD